VHWRRLSLERPIGSRLRFISELVAARHDAEADFVAGSRAVNGGALMMHGAGLPSDRSFYRVELVRQDFVDSCAEHAARVWV